MTREIFNRVSEELDQRDLRRDVDKARFLGIKPQTWYNWRERKSGVPPRQYDAIAERLGWSYDRLVRNRDKASNVVPIPRPEIPDGRRYQRLRAIIERARERRSQFFLDFDQLLDRWERDLNIGQRRAPQRAGPGVPRQRPAKGG